MNSLERPVTISTIPNRRGRPIQVPLGSTPAGPADASVSAMLVMAPGETPRVRLSRLSWGVGVGWYVQQTLDLGLDEARQIAALLGQAPREAQHLAGATPLAGSSATGASGLIDLARARARIRTRRTRLAPGEQHRAGAARAPIAFHRVVEPSDEALGDR